MSKVYYSLNEANEMVQKIKPQIEKIVQLRDELNLLDNTKIEFEEENVENYLLEVELNKNFHLKNLEMYKTIETLIRRGCIVRDIENLEIDFYSKLEDKDITFCWTLNQDKINFWHYPHETHLKKRPIKEIEKYYYEKLNKLR